MRKLLFFIIFLAPLLCRGQNPGESNLAYVNIKPFTGISEDFYFSLRKSTLITSDKLKPQAEAVSEDFYFSLKKYQSIFSSDFTPEVTGISEDIFISYKKKRSADIFIFNETPDIPVTLKKSINPVAVSERKDAEKNKKEDEILVENVPVKKEPDKVSESPDLNKRTVLTEGTKTQAEEKMAVAEKTDPSEGNKVNQQHQQALPHETPEQVSSNDIAKNTEAKKDDVNRSSPVTATEEKPQPKTEELVTREPKLPRYHALIIGVSNYKFAGTSLGNLERPSTDATNLSETLKKYYHFEKEDVHLLKDATRADIIDELEALGSGLTEKDNLIIFYAGHGYWDENLEIGYWLPSDAIPSKKSSWISNSTIKDYIGGMKTKHTLLVSDACFSGSIFKVREVETLNELGVSKLYQLPSRKAMTSGNMKTVPDKSKFFEYFNKRLVENEDHYLSARQLFQNFYVAVINNTNTVPQYGVIQETGDEGGEFIFIRREKK